MKPHDPATTQDGTPTLRSRRERLRGQIGSDTGRAAGLAGALILNNFVALIFTVLFARLLGASGYGSLGALLAAYTILLVPGSALQAAVAQRVSAAAVTPGGDPTAGIRRWLGRLLVCTLAAAAAGALAREQLAALVGVRLEWGAAAILPSAALWLVLCVERGALQGFQRYGAVGLSIVGEAAARVTFALALYGLGLGVTGAFLGTGASVAAMGVALAPALVGLLREQSEAGAAAAARFRDLLRSSWVPAVAFALIAALQNIDIVFVKREATDAVAGSYAATSVAAKAVIWVAIGLGLYLLPEAVRRTRSGADPGPVLRRTIGLIALVALPMVAVYSVAGKEVLSLAFGNELSTASDALPLLAAAMSLLAWCYLSVQYLLALGRVGFLALLAVAPLVELALLLAVGASPTAVATALLGLQLVLAPALHLIASKSAARARSPRLLDVS